MGSAAKLTVLLLSVFCVSESVTAKIKYTENEQQAIAKFRQMAAGLLYLDHMKEDAYLIRWIRVKDFNLPAALQMLKETVKWRKENKIDGILGETVLKFQAPPFHSDGIDVDGCPVGTFIPTRLDIRKLTVAGKNYEVVRFWDQFLEYGEVGLRAIVFNNTEADITQGTIIFDMQGYSLRQHGCLACVTAYYDWIRHYENYYPGLGKNLIMINTPRIFMPLLELLKPLMSKDTRRILKVFGVNKKEWSDFLLKFIPRDQLRHQFGGTMPE